MQLTRDEARRVMLAAQGLNERANHAATKEDVLGAIRRMGALQIDTIHVVARSPYLVLFSRLGDYEPRWLDDLLAEGALFEYWSHEACFLPIEDYALYRHRMIDAHELGWKYSHDWMRKHKEEVARVLEAIRKCGAVRSSDFERTDGKRGGWWSWKPEKRALEMLFSAGELMIRRRERFHRVYDLRERVLPSWDDSQLPPREKTERELVLKSVRALGVTQARWVGDYFRMNKKRAAELTRELAAEGALDTARVEGFDEEFYFHPEHAETLRRAQSGALNAELTTLLSPFDPLVWDRERALRLFDFDYKIECYTPAAKRRYGYFTLPLLRRGALVGRLDAKAHRKDGAFEVKSFHLESKVEITDELLRDVARALRECAAWHKTPTVSITQTAPKKLAAPLKCALKNE